MVIHREGVLLKNVVSFALDSLFRSLRNARFGDSLSVTRKDFSRLQQKDYLESVSIGALFRLASELSLRTSVRSVVFDWQQRKFILG